MSVADKIRGLVRRVAERQSALPDPKKAKRVFAPPLPSPVPDTGYSQALAGMVDTEFIKFTKYGDLKRRADMEAAHPAILEFTASFIRRMSALGVPMYAHCVWRTRDEQEAAYLRGTTKVRWPNSAHNAGCAVDIVHGRKHWQLTERQWALVGHVGHEVAASLGLKLTWGGNDGPGDKFAWDPAHWEITGWRGPVLAPWDAEKQPELADWRARLAW